MTACHLIADADLTLLGDVAAHAHTHAGLQLVAVLGGKDLDVDNDAVGTVGHTQGGVADLAGLLAEDGAQQALLGGQLGLALRGDLTDQNVAALDLGTDADDAAVIEVLQRVIADVRDVAGDLLGSELRVAGPWKYPMIPSCPGSIIVASTIQNKTLFPRNLYFANPYAVKAPIYVEINV